MVTVLCVLRSGGVYDATWVRKLRDGVARNLKDHRFVCLSDCAVPCERIELQHDWPGWWAKIEMFRPGVIDGPTLYLDLDTVITGPLDQYINLTYDFAMLENFHEKGMVGSGVMWFAKHLECDIYERFCENSQGIIDFYTVHKDGPYLGDQAFIWDCLGREVNTLPKDGIASYKQHCIDGIPTGTSLVCFGGRPRPTEIADDWIDRYWL